MRLTCPNCGAQYEVPDEVIPEEGRDVQCSNCETTWFQPKYPDKPAPAAAAPAIEDTPAPEAATAPEPLIEEPTTEMRVDPKPEPEPEAKPEPKTEPEPETPDPTGNIDPAVANILKEEAAREADLRAQEGGSIEMQPDLALDAPPKPEPERAIKELTATETAKDAGQKEALPDVEAINSSLRSDNVVSEDEKTAAPRKSGGGFMRGFALILIVGIILLLIYSNAQQISESVPQAEPILAPYVSLVDQARLWLEAQTSGTPQN